MHMHNVMYAYSMYDLCILYYTFKHVPGNAYMYIILYIYYICHVLYAYMCTNRNTYAYMTYAYIDMIHVVCI